MARTQRELWANLQSPQFGGPVQTVSVVVEVEGTTTKDHPVYVATRDVAIRRASFAQENSPDGAKTLQLVNATDTEDLTEEADSDALAAETAHEFTVNSNADKIDQGDVIVLEYTVDTAGTTAPEEVVVTFEVELLEIKND